MLGPVGYCGAHKDILVSYLDIPEDKSRLVTIQTCTTFPSENHDAEKVLQDDNQ
jgi:hypothetical protein